MDYILPGHLDKVANTHSSEAVRAGDLVFVSGQLAVDEQFALVGRGDVAAQARKVFDNMARVLAKAGSSLRDVVSLQFFVTDMAHREAITPARREYFGETRPVSTLIQVPRLPVDGALLLVNAIAAVGPTQVIGAGRADRLINTHYSEGIRAGELVFVAGMPATDKDFRIVGRGDMAAQARQVFRNIEAVMLEAGGSLNDVAKMHLWLTTIDDRTKITPVRYDCFGEHRSAANIFEISKFALDGMILEVSAIASLNGDRQYIEPGHLDKLLNTHLSEGFRAGKVVFVSGQIGLDQNLKVVGPGDAVAQARQVYKNIERVLRQAGASFKDVVQHQIFLSDVTQRTRLTPLLREIFGEHRPASTVIGVERLVKPELVVEIDAIAIIGG